MSCGIRHRTRQVKYNNGKWINVGKDEFLECKKENIKHRIIYLQVAHLNHDTTDNDNSNLRTLCPTCHHNHDKRHKLLMRIARLASETVKSGIVQSRICCCRKDLGHCDSSCIF